MDMDDPRVERLMRPMPEDYRVRMTPSDYCHVVGEQPLTNGLVVRLCYVKTPDADEAELQEALRQSLWQAYELARLGVDLPMQWTGAMN